MKYDVTSRSSGSGENSTGGAGQQGFLRVQVTRNSRLWVVELLWWKRPDLQFLDGVDSASSQHGIQCALLSTLSVMKEDQHLQVSDQGSSPEKRVDSLIKVKGKLLTQEKLKYQGDFMSDC